MLYGDARSYARFLIDLTCVALSPVIALLIRDNFDTSILRVQALAPYAVICLLVAAVAFVVARLPRSLWRYTSLNDILHLIAVATVVLLAALAASFYLNRMENIARSLPVIQWFLLITSMVGVRIAVRLLGERTSRKRSQSEEPSTGPEHVLIVGVGDVAELYLRSVSEFAQGQVSVVGILTSGPTMHGRSLRMHKILGRPENVQKILSELDLHGVPVERIIVMQPFERLSKDAREALLAVERSSTIEVDWLVESLGLRKGGASGLRGALQAASDKDKSQSPSVLRNNAALSHGQYHDVKRVIDGAGAILIIFALAPVLVVVSVLVAIDVGTPLVFWQLRPGRHGRPFKLFKFRTMRSAHDVHGNRISDQLRSSNIGNLLRRSRLDELPQLYNILLGEMSFIGPRPLLPVDQPQWQNPRLIVRPGLTGWAQINGGRDISPEDKAALDIWYIVNASLWLDISILLRTLVMLVIGEQVNRSAVQAAQSTLEKMKTQWAAGGLLTLPSNSGIVMSAGGAQEAP
jgi:lipopolysaccharide/colanic/teichoic acid biosynthesis glycosyltransferase